MTRITAVDARKLYEAYDSIYEKKDCVDKDKKTKHNCAKKVCHEEYGEGETIFGQHAIPDENGYVSHYDVEFSHGIVENVCVEDLEIITMVEHNEHVEYYDEEEVLDEMEQPMGQHPGKSSSKKVRDKYETETRRKSAPKGVGVPDKSVGYGGLRDDVDLFDVIGGYLISEGYADDEDSAISIMANMSEDWKNHIMDEISNLYEQRLTGPQRAAQRAAQRSQRQNAETQAQSDYKSGGGDAKLSDVGYRPATGSRARFNPRNRAAAQERVREIGRQNVKRQFDKDTQRMNAARERTGQNFERTALPQKPTTQTRPAPSPSRPATTTQTRPAPSPSRPATTTQTRSTSTSSSTPSSDTSYSKKSDTQQPKMSYMQRQAAELRAMRKAAEARNKASGVQYDN